jgi:hypothetical protein
MTLKQIPGEPSNHDEAQCMARAIQLTPFSDAAGVRVNQTTETLIVNCIFSHMGGAGLDIYGASQHTSVSGCFAHDISGTAIQFGGIDPW